MQSKKIIMLSKKINNAIFGIYCCPHAMQLTCSLHKVSLNFKN